ncbi:MAG: fused protease/ribonucleoside-triphosphate reductase [Candidatus Lokiarchaeota archaeon]|nr:fused protease/ribonucleoside-triphosphate reductase [Candidatus Lokiarchaeota archaeon]
MMQDTTASAAAGKRGFGQEGARFDISSIFPTHVINSQGIKERFNPEDIVLKLQVQTGLDHDLSLSIADQVVKKIISEGIKAVRSAHIRDLVFSELASRGLEKYKSLLNFGVEHFYLDDAFIGRYRGQQPKWGPLGYITYKRTYSRLKDDGTKEEFWETIRRVVEGCYSIQKNHCASLDIPWNPTKAQKSAQRMFEKIWQFKFIPPGRGLWIMGTDYVHRHGSMALNNCGFISTKNLALAKTRPFEFMMDALMLGVGVGFDTKGAGAIAITKPADGRYTFKVPDSREGWVEGLRRLLLAYFDGGQLPDFDYSLIRPRGSRIKGFGGTASGPEPLERLYASLVDLLETRIDESIRSTDIVDLMNFIGKCVVAGNVRRSAQIALGDPDDNEYITMKNPDLHANELMDRRWASNNSAIIDPDAGFDYAAIADSIIKNGEPGVVWLKNARRYSRMTGEPDWVDKNVAGVNPCGEQSLESSELCCLVETFPSNHDSYDEFQETLKYAYLYAKSVTLIRTHWKETNAIMLKNRRIGISMTGIIDAFARLGRRTVLRWCDQGYGFLRKTDEEYSNWLCVPRSVKITTVKPSGTTSLLPGVSPGIHYPHSEYYIRRIRIASNSDLIPLLRDAGYRVEPAATGERGTLVVEFPVRQENFLCGKEDVSMEMQVMNAIDLQRYWSDNQVSITVTFKAEEAARIKDVLQMCEDKLKSISFLPLSDHGYLQAPYESITKEEYEKRVAEIKGLDFSTYSSVAEGVKGCDGDHCEL